VKNNIINYLNTLPQTIVSDSSLDKLISKLPIVYDWVNYKGEDVVASTTLDTKNKTFFVLNF